VVITVRPLRHFSDSERWPPGLRPNADPVTASQLPTFLLPVLLLALAGLLAPAVAAEVLVVDSRDKPVEGAVLWLRTQHLDFPASPAPDGKLASPAAAEAVVDQRNKRFVPFVSWVRPGTSVRFPNSDDIRHHVYSFSENNTFERKLYRANDAAPVLLNAPGIVALGCNIHDTMQAYIVVSVAEPVGISDASGVVDAAPADDNLLVWHPMLPDTTRPLEIAVNADSAGRPTIRLPLVWQDPQAPRDRGDLEALLKKFSKDAP
jgi:plastocyanin